MELTGRLGYTYAQEYMNHFLIRNNVISGCCQPPEYYLYDKSTGQLKKSLGRIVFYSTDKNLPFIISVTNSNYTTEIQSYTSLTIYNIDQDKSYEFSLDNNEIDNALQEANTIYPEYLFEDPMINDGTVTLIYREAQSRPKNISPKKILLNLKKYI